MGLVRAYLTRGSYHGLYYSIEKPLKFFQTGALLEVSAELLDNRANYLASNQAYIYIYKNAIGR